MLGKLKYESDNNWWIHFGDYFHKSQMMDESIDTSFFQNNQEIEFELKLASNVELTKNSSNKFRAYPV
jgi:hypothetical protein